MIAGDGEGETRDRDMRRGEGELIRVRMVVRDEERDKRQECEER